MPTTSHTEVDPSKTGAPAGRFALRVRGEPEVALTSLDGIGPRLAARLTERGIGDQLDLLATFPHRYQRTLFDPDGEQFVAGRPEHVVFRGTVTSVRKPRPRSRQPLEVVVSLDDERVVLVWFHIPGGRFAEAFRLGRWIEVDGAVDWERNLPRITHPRTKWVDGPGTEPTRERWEPVYPGIEGVPAVIVRRAVVQAFGHLAPDLVDVVPADVRAALDLGSIREALAALHVIGDERDWETEWARARDRVVYEELFTLQLALAEQHIELQRRAAAPRCEERALGREVVRSLPFELTGDQRRVLAALADDLAEPVPMRRLLQGDVGAGKTVVAFLLAAIASGSGRQTALMAPTEVLAMQHWGKAKALLDPYGVEVVYLGGSLSRAQRDDALGRIADAATSLVIGTHALFSDDVRFANLGFVIVDEQHKFGVEQRRRLLDKGRDPHLLAMTATPIPRSLAHAVFGDLELAVLRERPPGREPVKTHLRDRSSREALYTWIADAVVGAGQQGYVVFPAIDEDARGFRALMAGAEELANGWLRGRRVGVLHGQMDAGDKLEIMHRFGAGEIDVLCATTVVEVGVDVANATVMVIESAEAFGLSQLHQLRGRVGRGEATSRCVLVCGEGASEAARDRLRAFEQISDGFELAEMDLRLRGPGEFLGARQAGAAEFRFADLLRDADLLEQARSDARRIIFSTRENRGMRPK